MNDIIFRKIFAQLILMLLAIPAILVLPSVLNAQTDLKNILDPQIDRSIPPGYTEYVIFVKTADEFEAGTDSNIFLTINGDGQNGITINNLKSGFSTGEIAFSSQSSQTYDSGSINDPGRITVTWGSQRGNRVSDTNYFERDSNHQINVIAKDVGNITSIKVRKDNFGSAPDWKLEVIRIKKNGKTYRFNANKWFKSDSNTHTFTSIVDYKLTTYSLQTYTGDVSGAGTDSNIFLTLEGFDEAGTPVALPEIRLNGLASGNLFERHKIDTIPLSNQVYLPTITKITIRSDNKYAGSAWYLGWINLSVGGKVRSFQVNDWIESGKLTKVLTTSETVPQSYTSTYKPPPTQLKCGKNDWIGTWDTTNGKIVIREESDLRVSGEFDDGRKFSGDREENDCEINGAWENKKGEKAIFYFRMSKEKSTFSGSTFIGNTASIDKKWLKWNGTKLNDSTAFPPITVSNAMVCSATDWVGTWKTNLFPEMTIKLAFGKGYTGVFSPANYPFTANIEGNACVIKGFWKDSNGAIVGAFRFTLSDKGNFAGAYVGKNDLNQDLSSKPPTWRGNKIGAAAVATSTSNPPNVSNPMPTAPPVNLSVGKFARQSSVGFGGVASRAVDGNTDGNWGNNSVTHTGGESGGWWEVDLGAVYNISGIRIFNRTDCCSDRLRQFRVSVSNEPFSSNLDGIQYAPLQGNVGTNPWTFSKNTQARYVRIYLNGTGVLSLAEVLVFGTPIR